MGAWVWMLAILWSTAAAAAPPQGYAVRQSLDLDAGLTGVNGRLELLQDADTTPRKGTRLRVVDRGGVIIDELVFEPPDATLEAIDLHGAGRPTYLLRVDYSAGRGPYYGLATFLLDIRNGRLRRLDAVDETGTERPGEDEQDRGRSEPIVLLSTLRSGWALIGDGAGKAILSARSRPHVEDPAVREGWSGDSITLFHTYRFRNGQWRRWERRMLGDWEDGGEDSWPDRRLFP